uniref:Uncharacterized protein n=1 Tax=Timema tahoe TaxID=61484 RepID=A0A7R9NXM6_9NEOP|nr:unnamed protein product [Timema tahoe]
MADPECFMLILAIITSLLLYFQPPFFSELKELSSFMTLFSLSFIHSGKSQEFLSFMTLLSLSFIRSRKIGKELRV